MLVTFTTDAHADITMFGEIALTMIEMMGHSKTVPGAILAADIPEALRRLKAAIENADKSLSQDKDEDEDKDKEDKPAVVNITNRALPLISLLTAAAKSNCDVMWK